MRRRGRDEITGFLFLLLAVPFAVLSYEATSKLWAAYRDSPSWVFASYGAVSGLLAVACVLLGIKSVRRRRR